MKLNMQLKFFIFIVAVFSYSTIYSEGSENRRTPNSESIKDKDAPQNHKNLVYVNVGPFVALGSVSIGYQRMLNAWFSLVGDLNYGGANSIDVLNSSEHTQRDNINLSETFWTISFAARFYPASISFDGLYCSLITTYYNDLLSISKGAIASGGTAVPGAIEGEKKISGIALGADVGYAFSSDHFVFFFAVGYILALPQQIQYTITNGAAVAHKSLSRVMGQYAFAPRITIAMGYAF